MPSVFPENMERGVSISSLYNFTPRNITTGLTDAIKYAYRKETRGQCNRYNERGGDINCEEIILINETIRFNLEITLGGERG